MHAPTLAAPAPRATPSRRGALEWSDAGKLLVVVTLVTVGVIAFMPSWMVSKRPAHKTSCGYNLRQIQLAMMVYRTDNDDRWPVRPTGTDGLPISDPSTRRFVGLDGAATVAATFEFLVTATGGEMTAKVFACPADASVRIPGIADPHLTYANGTSIWATAGVGKLAYAYDPGTPDGALPSRAVLSDRPLTATTSSHKNSINVIYADGHLGTVRLGGSGTASTTLAVDGTPITATAIGEARDDIFRPDHADPGGIGNGPATWAFLR